MSKESNEISLHVQQAIPQTVFIKYDFFSPQTVKELLLIGIHNRVLFKRP
jgi:hypothetical protein